MNRGTKLGGMLGAGVLFVVAVASGCGSGSQNNQFDADGGMFGENDGSGGARAAASRAAARAAAVPTRSG
jgi:hypothetical protein